MRTVLFVAVLALTACIPEAPKLGGLSLVTTASSFSVKADERVLVESAPGAAVATRVGKARYEMQYGSWKITDNSTPWNEGSAFSWASTSATEASGVWKDASDLPVMTVKAVSTGPGELALTYVAR